MSDSSNAKKPEEVEAEIVTDTYSGPAGTKPTDAGTKAAFGADFLKGLFKGLHLPFGVTPGVALGGVFVVLALIIFGVWSAQNSGSKDAGEATTTGDGARTAAAPAAQDLSLPPPSRDVGDAIDLSSGQPYSPPEQPLHTAPSSDVAPSIIDSVTSSAAGTAPGSFGYSGERIANAPEALKEAFGQETQSLARALAAERAQSQEQQAQIADLRARLEQLEAKEGTTSAGRQAAASLALLSLQRVAASGGPYQTELDILARLLTPGTPAIDRLRPRARDGAPTLATLKLRFEETARAAFVAEAAAKTNSTTSGVMSRLEGLISARPASPRAGGDPKAVVSRAEDQLDRNDLERAVRELEALKGPASETFGPWLADARARLAVDAAIEEVNGLLLKDYTN